MLKDYLYIYNNSGTSDDEESDVSLDEASLRKTKRGSLVPFFTYDTNHFVFTIKF